MKRFPFVGRVFLVASMPFAVMGQDGRVDEIPLKNWSAPAYWQPAPTQISVMRDATLKPQVTLPTQPLVFVAITPCRVIDTRAGAGFPSPFGTPSLPALVAKTYPIQSSTQCSIPSPAQAYSFNITVTPITTPGVNPPGYLGFLTVYPFNASNNTPPNGSTLNNYLGTVVSNAAIVPAGDNNGSVSFYAHDATDVIVDINGYYIQGSAGASQWSTSGLNIFYNTGNVGVGTSTPSQKLDVAGIGRFTSGVMFPDGNIQTMAYQGGGGGGSQWTTSGSTIYYNNGNVGIGTSSPAQKLEVNGNLQVDSNINLGGSIYSSTSGVPLFQASAGLPGNLGIGYAALQFVTPNEGNGVDNTGIGWTALQSTTTGSDNSAVGARTLVNNTTGWSNSAFGTFALLNNITGSANTAMGTSAIQDNISGNNNTAVGASALQIVTGSNNTAIGSQALESSTGSDNIAVGFNAGDEITSGSNNIVIGNRGNTSDSGFIRVGTAGTHTSTFIAGISGVNVSGVNVLVASTGQLGVASSSRRFKQDIENMGDATNNLMRLRPVTYRYKQTFEDGSQPLQYGLIAEEVAEVYPELVARSADGKIETVKYQLLDSMLLNEVQKQHATIKAQAETIDSQKDEIQSLKERLSRIESLLEKVAQSK